MCAFAASDVGARHVWSHELDALELLHPLPDEVFATACSSRDVFLEVGASVETLWRLQILSGDWVRCKTRSETVI